MARLLAVLAAFGLAVGASGPAEAGSIYTYTFSTDEASLGPAISGSFQVDSSHIGASGNTDISDFITGLSFTGAGLTFIAPHFHPETVTVTPTGDLTGGADSGFFIGGDTKNFLLLSVRAGGMTGQEYTGTSIQGGGVGLHGTGHWTRVLGEPAAVPEPSSLVLAGTGGIGLLALVLRRRLA